MTWSTWSPCQGDLGGGKDDDEDDKGDDEDEENEFKTTPCISHLGGRESKKKQNKRKNRAVVGHREKMKINS